MLQVSKRKVLTITLISFSLCLCLLSPVDARSLHATRDNAPTNGISAWAGWITRFFLGTPGAPAPGSPTDGGAWRSRPAGKATAVHALTGSCVDPNGHPITTFPCNLT